MRKDKFKVAFMNENPDFGDGSGLEIGLIDTTADKVADT